jgi:hypothetical protein
MPKHVQLVEDEQQTRGVAAAVDAIELPDVVHVFQSGARHMIDRAGERADTAVEPGACCRNSLALRRRQRFARCQQLRELVAIAAGEIEFNPVFAAEAVANKYALASAG